MKTTQPRLRITALGVLLAVAAFVFVHDMGTGAALDGYSASASQSHEQASVAHEALALCAITLVLGISVLGVLTSRRSTVPTRARVTSTLFQTELPSFVDRRRLYKLCVIQA